MKTLICQRWKTSEMQADCSLYYPENELHSLHLNEQHRLRFLNKNIKNYRGNGCDIDVKEYYQCDVEDHVYEEIIRHQTKHGLMFEDSPLPVRKHSGFYVPIAAAPVYRPSITDAEMIKFLEKLKKMDSKIAELFDAGEKEKITITTTKPDESSTGHNPWIVDSLTPGIHPYQTKMKKIYKRKHQVEEVEFDEDGNLLDEFDPFDEDDD